MNGKAIGIAALIGIGVWWFGSRKKAAATPGGGLPVIGLNPLTQAIVAVQHGSSGRVIDSSGKVVVSAPVSDAIASGGSAVEAAQSYLGHEIDGFTEDDYRYYTNLVNGSSLHQIVAQGMTTGIPGGIVPLEVSAYLDYKLNGYSANFQALVTPELIDKLDPIWAAEEASGETWMTPAVVLANPSLSGGNQESANQIAESARISAEQAAAIVASNIAQMQEAELARVRLAAVAEAQRQAEAALTMEAQAAAARTAAERAAAEQAAQAAHNAAAQAAQVAAQAGQTEYIQTLTPQEVNLYLSGGYFGY